jgi:hypothetical protein
MRRERMRLEHKAPRIYLAEAYEIEFGDLWAISEDIKR